MDENKDLYNSHPSTIVMYSTSWCPDCKRSRTYLEAHQIKYMDVDIGKDNQAFLFIEKLTRRVRIPTIIFPDGAILIEPSDAELSEKTGTS